MSMGALSDENRRRQKESDAQEHIDNHKNKYRAVVVILWLILSVVLSGLLGPIAGILTALVISVFLVGIVGNIFTGQ